MNVAMALIDTTIRKGNHKVYYGWGSFYRQLQRKQTK
jgi:hypothetical protein